MHLGKNAAENPDRTAIIFADEGRTVSYRSLEESSRRAAHLLREWGLQHGDGIAVVLRNQEAMFVLYWAAMRAGMYFTPVNWHLAADEIQYIVDNSDARVMVTDANFADDLRPILDGIPKVERRVAVGGAAAGFDSFEDALAKVPDEPLAEEFEGATMLYSSGTTGRPKGVRNPLERWEAGSGPAMLLAAGFSGFFGLGEGDVYLCPGPLYHAAPLMFTMMQHRIGGTACVMDRFKPEKALEYIEKHQVTTSQWVPTHFSRMLALPDDVRARYSTESLKIAIHAAAPCPIHVKEAMIEWWGPKIVEYYAGTEGGGTIVRSEEWLEHKGSVGKHWAGGKIFILDENDQPIEEPNVDGGVYFEGPEDPKARFKYYKDEEKTAGTFRGRLFSLGDIGHLDADGYLYLTDRKSHMIISGGVNIYPQEVENCMSAHPKILDVAVIGVPDDDMGEQVKAVVQLREGETGSEELAAEMIGWVREQIAHYKAPRSVDFVEELPRQENGKIYKRLLRDQYKAAAQGGS